jgi:5'-3' exoribonuclease 1
MGIPSYFSYIVKNHQRIIQKLERNKKPNNFYLDSNSIVYDVINNAENYIVETTTYGSIISLVISKIEEYILFVSPTTNVFIAFDGVAPFAKLEQQRQRRYKSWYQNKIHDQIFASETASTSDSTAKKWNSAAITPGTQFMKELNIELYSYFNNARAETYNVNNLIVSGSNQVGEGEHKIFDYIRKNSAEHHESSTIIYGLDSDLIMLALNHVTINPHIYLFREAPHFSMGELEPSESYLMDIGELSKQITIEMNGGPVVDYIFLCFFLGNDFMPHFPSLNIRTGGIDKMLNAYKEINTRTKSRLTDGTRIYWKHVRNLCAFLAKHEETNFIQEVALRDKKEGMYKRFEEKTPENRFKPKNSSCNEVRNPTDSKLQQFKKFELLPSHEREVEKYINPLQPYWQHRYYETLFNFSGNDAAKKRAVSLNYLEGLEWNIQYYTSGCPDWKWKYNYHYPPLLCDLLKEMPYFETDKKVVYVSALEPVTELFQLYYVLPKDSAYLLPHDLKEKKEEENDDYEFIWCFCKYFWECHVII